MAVKGERQITVKIVGEAKQFTGTAQEVEGWLGKLDAAAGKSGVAAQQAGGIFGALKSSIGSEFSGSLGAATGSLDKLGGAFGLSAQQAAGAAAGIAAAGVAIGATVSFVKNGIGAYTDLADKVREFKDITGATAEDSSRLIAALDDVGVSAEAGSKAFGNLAKNADSKGFAALGVEIAKTKDGTTDLGGTFENLLKKLDGITDPIQRANVLQTAFGKSWQDLLPLIDRGAEGYERLLKANENSGQILTDKDLANAREFKAAIDNLQDAFQKFSLEVGKFALPFVKTAAEDIAKFAEGIDKAGGFVGGLVQKVGFLEPVGKAVLATFLALPVALHELANISLDKVKGALQSLIDIADKIAGPFVNFPDDVFNRKQGVISSAVDKSKDAIQAMIDKAKAGGGAMGAMGDAAVSSAEQQKALEKALKDLDAAMGKQIDAVVKMPAAQKAVDDAARALAEAHKAETAATEGSTQATKTAAQERYAAAQAARDEAEATDRIKDAKAREVEVTKSAAADIKAAEKEVDDLRATRPKLLDDVRRGQEDLAKAQRDATRAAEEEEAAQRRYQQVIGTLPPDIREVTKAQQEQLNIRERLAALSDDLVGAEDRLKDAQNALADAQKNLPAEAEEAMASARIKVAEAADRVAAAEAKLTADRNANKPPADIAKDERDLEQARMASAAATREQEKVNREWGDTSDELNEKLIAVHQAERNLERVKRDQAKATDEEKDATAKLNEVQNGAAEGSDREREAKEKLTTAHDKTVKAKDAERDASAKLVEVQNTLLALPDKISAAIDRLRDTETKSSKARKEAHEGVTKAVDDQRLAGLKAAAEAEKDENKKQEAINKTKKTAEDYTSKALALVDAEVALRENAATRAGKALDSVGLANARLDALEAARRKALYDGHTKTVAELDQQIKAIQDLRGEHDIATGKLVTNSATQVGAVKTVTSELDTAAKPRTAKLDTKVDLGNDNDPASFKGLVADIGKARTSIIKAKADWGGKNAGKDTYQGLLDDIDVVKKAVVSATHNKGRSEEADSYQALLDDVAKIKNATIKAFHDKGKGDEAGSYQALLDDVAKVKTALVKATHDKGKGEDATSYQALLDDVNKVKNAMVKAFHNKGTSDEATSYQALLDDVAKVKNAMVSALHNKGLPTEPGSYAALLADLASPKTLTVSVNAVLAGEKIYNDIRNIINAAFSNLPNPQSPPQADTGGDVGGSGAGGAGGGGGGGGGGDSAAASGQSATGPGPNGYYVDSSWQGGYVNGTYIPPGGGVSGPQNPSAFAGATAGGPGSTNGSSSSANSPVQGPPAPTSGTITINGHAFPKGSQYGASGDIDQPGGDIGLILRAIRQSETGNRNVYNTQGEPSHGPFGIHGLASGVYQFIGTTWRGIRASVGASQYDYALVAPISVQHQAAIAYAGTYTYPDQVMGKWFNWAIYQTPGRWDTPVDTILGSSGNGNLTMFQKLRDFAQKYRANGGQKPFSPALAGRLGGADVAPGSVNVPSNYATIGTNTGPNIGPINVPSNVDSPYGVPSSSQGPNIGPINVPSNYATIGEPPPQAPSTPPPSTPPFVGTSGYMVIGKGTTPTTAIGWDSGRVGAPVAPSPDGSTNVAVGGPGSGAGEGTERVIDRQPINVIIGDKTVAEVLAEVMYEQIRSIARRNGDRTADGSWRVSRR